MESINTTIIMEEIKVPQAIQEKLEKMAVMDKKD
jgi:hypothetical protein